MECDKKVEQDLFEQLGLSVAHGEVEVGKTYPIFGMITSFLHVEPGQIVVELNSGIEATMNISDPERLEVLKERIFEPGIFVCNVLRKEPRVSVDCASVIFGKRRSFDA